MEGLMRKTVEDMTKHLWRGSWVDGAYILETCPFCGGKRSLKFYGESLIWQCYRCNRFGDPMQLKQELLMGSDRERYETLFDDLAEEREPPGLIVVSKIKPQSINHITTGFPSIDRLTGGFADGMLTILAGKQGEGKSTFAGQLALNAIEKGNRVCFYSGELTAAMFRSWIYGQAAGNAWIDEYIDQFGSTRHACNQIAAGRISQWLGTKLILYDNTIVKSSERNSILARFMDSRRIYNSNLFIVDNLMTAKYDSASESGFFREQSKFVGELVDFAQQEGVHVILVAHPKKEDTGDFNDNVSGSGDVTRRSSLVFTMERLSQIRIDSLLLKGEISKGTTNILHISKNREFGDYGKVQLAFDPTSKRLYQRDQPGDFHYGWEDII
jgi:twinkle protein